MDEMEDASTTWSMNDPVTGDFLVECAWVRLRIPRKFMLLMNSWELESFIQTGINVGLAHPELRRKK